MYKEYIIIFFVLYIIMGALPFTETIIFGNDENLSFKSLNKIEKFGTQKSSNSILSDSDVSQLSDKELSSITKINIKKMKDKIANRIYGVLSKKITELNKNIEEKINEFIVHAKTNKKLTTRILNNKYFEDSKLNEFKKDLYSKLSKSKMTKLYYPITKYFDFLNNKTFPTIFKHLLIETKYKMTSGDNFLIRTIVRSLVDSDLQFKVSEFIFMYTLLRQNEHKTLNKKLINAMLKQNPKLLFQTSPIHMLPAMDKYFNLDYLSKMRLDTFLVYITFFYSKFIKQIIMFRKLSFFQKNFELKIAYRRFLITTSEFVNEINKISLSLFKSTTKKYKY